MTIIARLYPTHEAAVSAAEALKKRGFDAGAIHVVDPPAGRPAGTAATTFTAPVADAPVSHAPVSHAPVAGAPEGETPETVAPREPAPVHEAAPPAEVHAPLKTGGPADDAVLAAIRRTGVPRAHAVIYAEHVRKGASLVVCDPPFSMGQTAESIMHGFSPTLVDVPWVDHRHGAEAGGGDAAPLSRALGWKVLSSDPTPLSSKLGWRTLLPENTSSASLETVRRQSREAAPLSRLFRLPTLSANPAPLSSAVKFKPLSDTAAPLSDKAKFRTLLDDAAPLSSKLGWKTISSNPAPLSSLLGLPVLISSDSGRKR